MKHVHQQNRIHTRTPSFIRLLPFSKAVTVAALCGSTLFVACKKSSSGPASYQQVNLVSDTPAYSASRIDANLANPWGIAIGPTGAFWIASNHSGSTVIYDGTGAQLLAPVTINVDPSTPASPSGVVYNGTGSFMIPGGQPAVFIYATEDGILSAWSSGPATVTVADRTSANAVYKGLTIANDGTGNFIYATDFHNGKVDVFDQSFNYVTTKPFADPGIPAGFAPFNIQNIGGQLYVTYAKQKGPDNMDDQAGTGFGYVDIYKPDGSFVKRFASQGTLNSPWAVVQAPSGFGLGSNMILVGNFGDGHINIFDANGNYKGQLMNGNTPIAIDGLWGLMFPTSGTGGLDVNKLYFTAGPQSETYGIFGYLQKK